jgi:hypothetical protein
VTDFLSFCPFRISIFPFCTIGISMYQTRILPYIIIPYFLTPSFFPFRALQTDRRTDFNTPRYLTSCFFPLSARGPTRRRNSTGLAELWGGWPIEQVHKQPHNSINGRRHYDNPTVNNDSPGAAQHVGIMSVVS